MTAAAAAATGILVGSAMVATRFVIDQTTPSSLAFLRYLIGVSVLLPALLAGRRLTGVRGRDLLPIGLLGIAQFGVVIVLLNYALQFIPAARAALIFATVPLLAMLMASGLRLEPLTLAKTTGVIVTICGVSLALAEKAVQATAAGQVGWLGELAALGSALTAAGCSVLYRPYLARYSTLAVSAVAMLVAVGFLAILAAAEGFLSTVPRFTAAGWLAVVFIGGSSGVGYFLWLWALGRGTPTSVTVFLALGPITAAALGAVVLREQLTWLTMVGVAAVLVGLASASLGDRIGLARAAERLAFGRQK